MNEFTLKTAKIRLMQRIQERIPNFTPESRPI